MKIVCIGSGNVATHIAQAFKACGAIVTQVWSKSIDHAIVLASLIEAEPISDFHQIDRTADLYIIAVKDDAIAEVAATLMGLEGLVLHTSGSTGIEVLGKLKNYGVLYPLQTFSKAKDLKVREIPLFIEAANTDQLPLLRSIANMISPLVYDASSDKRRVLHLSAVFACNFVNQLYTLSANLVEHHGLQFEMLKPLILETALKVQTAQPKDVQTGPAVRGDEKTIERHLQLLAPTPELAEIYRTLSNSIKKTHL